MAPTNTYIAIIQKMTLRSSLVQWQGYTVTVYTAIHVIRMTYEELLHVGSSLPVSFAVEGISWNEEFLELPRQFEIPQTEYGPMGLSVLGIHCFFQCWHQFWEL
jgi:hypothetical protein